jgi:L-alanine-DL-glutamate epimerase-like enolase superfamily enzyme
LAEWPPAGQLHYHRSVIASCRASPLELRLRSPFRLSRGTSETRHNVLFEIAVGGSVGRGEAAPIPRYGESAESAIAALERMAGGLADPQAFAVEGMRLAVPGERAAQAAFDAALHDLAGRRLGVPVRELLGLAGHPLPPTSWTIGVDPIPEALAKVSAAGAFEVLKVKMGVDGDLELVRAVRDATRQRIRVDANEGWTLDGARRRLPELARLGVEFVEQPLPADRLDEARELRRDSPLPLIADESVHDAADVPRLVGAFDGINVKLAKCGGIAPALRLIATARAHGLGILLGCMIESSLGIAAALAVAPLADWIDLDGHLLLADDPFAGLDLVGGRVVPSDRPGLGVEPRAADLLGSD